MDWGLQNRISHIIKPNDNRALMLAVDHGYFLGPTEKRSEEFLGISNFSVGPKKYP